MSTQLDQISAAIGALQAEVSGLRRDFTESTRRADDHRTSIHKRVDDLVGTVGEVQAEVSGLASTVDGMQSVVKDSKAVTDEVKQWKQRGIGALAMAGIAGTVLGGAVVAFIAYWWDVIMRVLRTA